MAMPADQGGAWVVRGRGRWLRRVGIAVLVFAFALAAGVAWLLDGWNVERRTIALMPGVSFRETPLGGAGLRHFLGPVGWMLDRVTYIEMPAGTTDGDLSRLRSFEGLQSLYLGGSHITDAGLGQLERLKGLRLLYLGDTAITDAGLAHLRGLLELRRLFLWDTKVTAEGVKKLQAELPGTAIEY